MKNYIFVSPHFPVNYRNFCIKLHENGVNVLGIGDAPYDSLDYMLQGALTEYYRVNNMENYDEMYRAVAFFCFKYGKIDGLESNNEYWLEQDARLRLDFNIPGLKPETLTPIKSKSGMKKFYAQAGVPSARYHLVTDLAQSLAFIEKVGYPVIAKPNNGVGAVDTFKINSDEELKAFHDQDFGSEQFIMEEFVPGEIFSYDAIIGSNGQPLLETGNNTPRSIMEIVNNQESCFFYIEKQIKDDLREAGRRCVDAFGIRSRFIHFEFFRLLEDHAYLGKKGTIVSLEANLPDRKEQNTMGIDQKIWDFLIKKTNNAFGTAAIMSTLRKRSCKNTRTRSFSGSVSRRFWHTAWETTFTLPNSVTKKRWTSSSASSFRKSPDLPL